MKPLETRKQLLIVESELNRAQLIQEWHTLTGEVDNLAARISSFKTIVMSAMSLLSRMTSFAGNKAAEPARKSSWFQKVASGARLASSVWLAFNNPRKSDSEK